jgi:trk system potassium uptake protein TrkH
MAPNTLLGILGTLLVGFAATQALPLAVALALGERGSTLAFALSAGAALFFGVVLVIAGAGARRPVTRRDAMVLTVAAWFVLAAFGALPFAFGGAVSGYSRALFEAMSGLTTTGLSAIDNLAAIDRSILLWRALLQWLGGYATVLFAAALVPQVALVAPGGGAEPTSRRAGEAFRPRIIQVAGQVGLAYLGLTLLCLFALLAVGLGPLSAASYAMSAISTGGFAPDAAGPRGLGNPAAEAILVVAMVAGAINFLVHWAAVSGRPATYLRDPECGFLLVLLAAATALLAVAHTAAGGLSTEKGWWRAVFDAVSAATTTGFGGGAPAPLPVFALLILVGLAVIGGSSVSTAGGIKQTRALLLLRQSARELERLAHPHGVVLVKLGRVSVTDTVMQGVWAFFVLFVFCLIVLSIALSASGLGFAPALVLAASAMANTGPLLAESAGIGGTLGALPETAHWLLTAGMLVGRLEVFAVLVLLTPLFWQR